MSVACRGEAQKRATNRLAEAIGTVIVQCRVNRQVRKPPGNETKKMLLREPVECLNIAKPTLDKRPPQNNRGRSCTHGEIKPQLVQMGRSPLSDTPWPTDRSKRLFSRRQYGPTRTCWPPHPILTWKLVKGINVKQTFAPRPFFWPPNTFTTKVLC